MLFTVRAKRKLTKMELILMKKVYKLDKFESFMILQTSKRKIRNIEIFEEIYEILCIYNYLLAFLFRFCSVLENSQRESAIPL